MGVIILCPSGPDREQESENNSDSKIQVITIGNRILMLYALQAFETHRERSTDPE